LHAALYTTLNLYLYTMY